MPGFEYSGRWSPGASEARRNAQNAAQARCTCARDGEPCGFCEARIETVEFGDPGMDWRDEW